MKKKLLYFGLFLLSFIAFYMLLDNSDESEGEYSIDISNVMSDTNSQNFRKADSIKEFIFPDDHGPHNDFKLEWWYFTGNVQTDKNESFGYQFTIFRNALSSENSKAKSEFASNQLYFAHLGITDVRNNKHYSFEKFARGAAGLAKAGFNPLTVNVEDWILDGEYINGNFSLPNMQIKASEGDFGIDLKLVPQKGIVLHGNKGLSRKSNSIGNASYYYSLTRLLTTGTIKVGRDLSQVNGNSWMDREWSTSALSTNQKGWDWFSIQLEDNSELMYFRLRDTNSNTDFAKGTYIMSDGKSIPLESKDIIFEPISTTKLKSNIVYPNKWEIKIPLLDLIINAQTQVEDQEMKLSVRYYEGSIKISALKGKLKLGGYGYVELTGYEKK